MTLILISKNIMIELFLRYVDDVNLVLRVDNPNNNAQDTLERDVSQAVVEFADSIHPGVLKFEADIPSNHDDKKLPILDIRCWIKDNNIQFDFYKKEVNTDNVLGPNSGFTPKVLRNILLQEYLRRLFNCSRNLDRCDKMIHLTRYNLDVKNAGHTEKFRNSITAQAIQIYDQKMKDKELFRTKDEIQESGMSKPDKTSWFKKYGDCDVIFNVPPTPDQELLGEINTALSGIHQDKGTKVKPIQSFGRTIISQIMTRDIGSSTLCDRKDCLVCIHPGSKGKCKLDNICYQINCNR